MPALIRVDDRSVRIIDRTGLRIGREATCDLVIPDPSVSRLHAELVTEGGTVVLRDLGRNGTYVNGERIEQSRPLRPGDRVRVGKYEFEFTRRPAAALGEAGADVTPIRAAVPDAPTVRAAAPAEAAGSGRWLRWAVILIIAAIAASILLRG